MASPPAAGARHVIAATKEGCRDGVISRAGRIGDTVVRSDVSIDWLPVAANPTLAPFESVTSKRDAPLIGAPKAVAIVAFNGTLVSPTDAVALATVIVQFARDDR